MSHLHRMNICRKYYIVEALVMAPHPPGGPKSEQIKNLLRLWFCQLICTVNWKEAALSPVFSWLVSLFSSTNSKLQCGVPSCAQGPVKPCPGPVTSLIPTCQSKASWLTPPLCVDSSLLACWIPTFFSFPSGASFPFSLLNTIHCSKRHVEHKRTWKAFLARLYCRTEESKAGDKGRRP